MGYRDYSTAKGHIVDSTGHGDFTSIQDAINAASSGESIFIRPGTYTEALTFKPEVQVTAFYSSEEIPTVTIVGTQTITTAGTYSISNIRFQTNGANSFVISGSDQVNITLDACYLNCPDFTGIAFSNSNAASSLTVVFCYGDLGTTGISYFTHTSSGTLNITYSNLGNSGGSTTSSTVSSGRLGCVYSTFAFPITTSGTSATAFRYCNLAPTDTTALTIGGSGSQEATECFITGGTAAAIDISSTFFLTQSTIISSNSDAITGSGTLNYNNLTFELTSQVANTLTLSLLGSEPSNAPSGYLWTSTGQFTSPTWQAAGSGIDTIDGDTGSATGSTVTFTGVSGGGTLRFSASGSAVNLFTTDANLNTFLGQDSGLVPNTAASCTAVGYQALNVITNAGGSTGIGAGAGVLLTSGDNNTLVGRSSAQAITTQTNNTAIGNRAFFAGTGSGCTALGSSALGGVSTCSGSNNIAIGLNSGTSLTTTDANNIFIANSGTAGDNNVIRIGTQGTGSGQQSTCYIAGVQGVSVSNLNYVTINTATGQMGSTSAASSGFITSITGNSGGAEVPSSGNFNIVGTGSITVAGSANTETVQLTGLTNHALQVGAGTATLTQLAVGSTGTVLIGNTGADPSFSATPTVTSITFGAGSALNAYTTGTFTPVLTFSGTSSVSFTTQSGKYWKIGALVYFNIYIVTSSTTGSTGNATITGLPFTSANDTGNGNSVTNWYGTGPTNILGDLASFVSPNSTLITPYYGSGLGTGLVQLSATNFANANTFGYTGFYWTT